jgi:hypothetical protein
MDLIYDLIDPEEMLGFVRGLEFPRFNLNRFLPDVETPDIEYQFTKGSFTDKEVAYYRAWDTEPTIGRREGLTVVRGELPPVNRMIPLTEEQRMRLRAILGGGGRDGARAQLIRAIFNDARAMVRAVQARAELARGQALSTCTFSILENGGQGEVEFGLDPTHDVASPTPISDPTFDVVGWLRSQAEVYAEDADGPPAVGLTSTKVVNYLMRNESIRELAGAMAGGPSLVTVDTIAQVLASFGLPPLETYDTTVQVRGAGGARVKTRVIPDDLLIWLPETSEDFGTTEYGITAEATEMIEQGRIELEDAPGIVAVVMRTFSPIQTWTNAAGIIMPVIRQPEAHMILEMF